MAELTDRPFPPGDYPLIVVGSGPGGLQVSTALRGYGIEHAVLSADAGPVDVPALAVLPAPPVVDEAVCPVHRGPAVSSALTGTA